MLIASILTEDDFTHKLGLDRKKSVVHYFILRGEEK